MARRPRASHEIPAGSMADIAFLLLIFFLLVTTIDIDKGIYVVLPPWPENEDEIIDVKLKDRNLFAVLINSRDQLLVEGELMRVSQLKEAAKEFVGNPYNRDDLAITPEDAVISLKNDRGTSYNIYIQVQNELKAAYNELRNEASMRKYGELYADLTAGSKEQKAIRKMYPIKISEAEPENIGGSE